MNNSPARDHYTAMREKTPRPKRLSRDIDWRRIEMNASLIGVSPYAYYLFTHKPDEYRAMKADVAKDEAYLYGTYAPEDEKQNAESAAKELWNAPPHPWWRFW